MPDSETSLTEEYNKRFLQAVSYLIEWAKHIITAVEVPLPIPMHTGQIIMLTKMLTASDLRFYEFDDDAPVETWHAQRQD